MGHHSRERLYRFVKYLENLLAWRGVYWEERRLYSTICPICGGKLVVEEKLGELES